MSVRESDRQKNCSGRGLGIAAAAIGVGVGAALYYFFSKRAENPGEEGSTSVWDCEGPHSLHEDTYSTISEHTTTDTSIASTDPDDHWSEVDDINDSFGQNTTINSYVSAELNSDVTESNSDPDSSTASEYSTDANSTVSITSSESDFGDEFNSLFENGGENSDQNISNMTDWRTIYENRRDSQRTTFNVEEIVPRFIRPTIVSDIVNGNVNISDASFYADFPHRPSFLRSWFGLENVTQRRHNYRSGHNRQTDSSFEEVETSPNFQSRARNLNGRNINTRTSGQREEELRAENFRQREWKVEECSICFDSMTADQEVLPLACTHRFHQACILPWLQEHQTCPMCRKNA